MYTSVKESGLSAEASSLKSRSTLTLFSTFCNTLLQDKKVKPYNNEIHQPNNHIKSFLYYITILGRYCANSRFTALNRDRELKCYTTNNIPDRCIVLFNLTQSTYSSETQFNPISVVESTYCMMSGGGISVTTCKFFFSVNEEPNVTSTVVYKFK